MTDSMKFGPEWLRNMASDGTQVPPPKYQLADHRYGREEMLALFDRMVKAPDPLNGIPALYVEKTQQPLALIQMNEEETRMWNRGVNSDAVLRLNGKMPPPAAEPRVVSLGREPGRGRGGSVDRGRGRARGQGGYYNRGLSYEEPGDGVQEKNGSFIRSNSRPFERPINMSGERGWGERNGADPTDWNGSTSPRKGGGVETNWRRSRGGGEDEDGWRTQPTSKWARPSSWREGDKEGGEPGARWEPGSRGHRGWDSERHHADPDNLPEWAMENPSESGGSFDASGAFHGGNGSDEEQDGVVNATGLKERKSSESPGVKKSSDITKKPASAPSQPANQTSQSPVSQPSQPLLKPKPDPNSGGQSQQTPHIAKSQSASSVLTSDPSSAPSLSKRTNHSPPGVKKSPSEQAISIPKQNVVNNSVTLSKNPSVSSSVIKEVSPTITSNHFQAPSINPLMDVLTSNFQEPSFNINTQFQPANMVQSNSGFNQPRKTTIGFAPPTSVNNQFGAGAQFNPGGLYSGVHPKKPMEDDRMQMHEEEVAKLTAEVPRGNGQTQDKWFYMDPQGEVQGPFAAHEMDDWFKAGYFTVNLLVRRGCDERYSQLGELIKIWGRIPFQPGPNMPPLKLPNSTDALPQTKPLALDPEAILQQQQFQYQQQQQIVQQNLQKQLILQKQIILAQLSQTDRWNTLTPVEQHQMVLQQMMVQKQMVHGKLSQSDRWATLSQLEQDQLVMQQMVVDPGAFLAPQPQPPPKNPVMQLISQMKAPQPPQNDKVSSPLQQLIQQMGGMQSMMQSTATVTTAPVSQPTVSTAPIGSQPGLLGHKEEDPIQSLIRQLNASAKTQVDVWGNPYPSQSWMTQGGVIPPGPPSQLPASMWDLQGKDMKTEQQIIEEQIRAEEEKRLEEALKREADEKRKKREEAKRKEAERQRLEEEKRRHEEEKAQKKVEEEKRKLEVQEQKRLEEELRKKEKEEKKRREEEKKKKEEEKKRKEEEKERKRKLEEERKREEEEKKRLEEEAARKRQEEEEQVRRMEQQRVALKRLQEKQQTKQAPWSQQPPPIPGGSLADIQRQEREKKERDAREQQVILQQLQLQQQQQQQLLAAAAAESKNPTSLQLKWVERKPQPSRVQSLAEIQAEEARQAERERVERAVQQKEQAAVPQSAGIWSGASQLSWTQSKGSVGFWDDVPSAPAKPAPKAKTANHSSAAAPAVPKTGQSKTRTKKDEAVVMKLFDNQRGDDFTQWCSNTLQTIQASVDIPTFANFLRDIESPYEVREYVKMYLGEGKEAQEFARQFLERRSRWRSAQRAAPQHDDLAQPAPAINPAGQQDFTEVKGKGKKVKKNKMFRVDNRILGFSVTAAQDRINVGDRDYGEGV